MRENNNIATSTEMTTTTTTKRMISESMIARAIDSLGKGFDLTSDFRLKYCKGRERLILLSEEQKKPLFVPGFGTLANPISIDVKCDKGDNTRNQSDILDFSQVILVSFFLPFLGL